MRTSLRILFTLFGTIILVRHAERAGEMANDPALTEKGRQRAEVLSRMLGNSRVDAIYTSEARRTQQTAEPLAEALRKKPIVIPGKDITVLVDRLKQIGPDEVVLVVGHSNTLPEIVSKLGGSTQPIGENEFNRMLIVVTHGSDKPSVLTLRYGD